MSQNSPAQIAAQMIHDQYKSAIKALCGLEPFRKGEETRRLIAEEIQLAIDKSNVELIFLLAEAEKERDSLRAQLGQQKREESALLVELSAQKNRADDADALEKALKQVSKACEEAATVFDSYVLIHGVKGTEDGMRKAAANKAHADRLRAALPPQPTQNL